MCGCVMVCMACVGQGNDAWSESIKVLHTYIPVLISPCPVLRVCRLMFPLDVLFLLCLHPGRGDQADRKRHYFAPRVKDGLIGADGGLPTSDIYTHEYPYIYIIGRKRTEI